MTSCLYEVVRSLLFADGRTDWAGKTNRHFTLKQAITPVWHIGCILPFASKDIQSLHFVTQSIHVYNIDDRSVAQWLRCCATNRKVVASVCSELLTGKFVRGVNNLRVESERQCTE